MSLILHKRKIDMKRIISVLIIAVMLFASLMNVIPAFAEDIELNDKNDVTVDINAIEARLVLEKAIKSAQNLIPTDYTDKTADELKGAIELASLVYNDENSEYSAILEAISTLDTAIFKLTPKKADLNKIKLFYTQCKYSDTVKNYVQTELANVILHIESALSNENILISEVERIENMIDGISRVEVIETAEDFMSMQSNGNYVLANDIILDEPYPEFKGYLHGDGHSISVSNGGIFTSLNGATLIGFEINGNISSIDTVGALSNTATDRVQIINVVNNVTVNANTVASGFIAESSGANLFFNGCINNADIYGNISAGFLAKADGESVGNILFEYCASLGNIDAKYSAGAFFGSGKSNIEMYGCVVCGDEPITVSVSSADVETGGVIGNAKGGIDINASYFNLDVISNKENAIASLIFGGANVSSASVKSVFASGNVIASGNNAYRLTSLSLNSLSLDTVLLNVTLKTYIDGVAVENLDAVDTIEKLDILALDEESVKEASYGITALLLSVTSNADSECKAEAVNMYIKSLKAFKTPEQAELDRDKAEMIKAIQSILKAPDDYTQSSYSEYLEDIEKLILDINVADKETFEALDCFGIIDLAEKKLVTLEQAKLLAEQTALKEAKAVALAILSAKRENAGKMFTQDSYLAYLKAFDSIVEQINSATDVSVLQALDVPSLKVEAENKLIVNVPEIIEEDYEDDEKIEIEDDEKENAENNVQNSASAEKDGCSSMISLSALLAVGLLGIGFVRKKQD